MQGSDPETIHRPSREDIAALAQAVGFSFNEQELDDYHALLDGAFETLEALDEFATERYHPTREYTDRAPGYRPTTDEDPYNAWVSKGTVEGASSGRLDGLTVGLKDNVALAGYELTAGTSVLEGYVPQTDATIVTRLLDAGATILGKTNMEALAFSGSSALCDFGTVLNPVDPDYLVGGSSSGSAAAVAAGDCDLAIGGDQAGSIRIPSAWSGIVGLKPTYGLVPYTGILPIDLGYDHTGPMAQDVATVARALEVLAGVDTEDGLHLDPRQPREVPTEPYTGVLDVGVDGLTIGVLEEGFDWELSEQAVDDAVRDAIGVFETLGAETEPVSMSLHRQSEPILSAIAIQGGSRMLREAGVGTNHRGWFWEDAVEAVSRAMESRTDDLPPTVKTVLLAGEYLQQNYNVSYYAKAKNLGLEAQRRYDDLFETVDLLAMPTTPMQPFERDDALDRVDRVKRVRSPTKNTGMFNVTGHPALSIPCAKPNGLPVGLMLVGPHYDETTILAAAAAFEDAVDWESR